MQREKERKEKNKQTNSNSGNTGSQSVSNDNMISECVTTYPPEHRFACVCTYVPVDGNAGGNRFQNNSSGAFFLIHIFFWVVGTGHNTFPLLDNVPCFAYNFSTLKVRNAK